MDNLDEGEKDWKDFEKSLEVCIIKILVSQNNIYPAIFFESPLWYIFDISNEGWE